MKWLRRKSTIIYEETEWAKKEKEEREKNAKIFWQAVSIAEDALGRVLTDKEVWRLMQQEKWHCVGCGEKLEKIDSKLVQCPICGLRFRKKSAKSKIECIGNMEA